MKFRCPACKKLIYRNLNLSIVREDGRIRSFCMNKGKNVLLRPHTSKKRTR